MSEDVHEQARELIALAGDQDLSQLRQHGLQTHLQECEACREYAEAVSRTLSALRSEPFVAGFSLVQATNVRVRSRAVELRRQQERTWLLGLACTFVGLSAAISTPLLWKGLAWFGARESIASWVWQSGFTLFWIAPALVVSAVLLARGTHLTNHGEGRGA